MSVLGNLFGTSKEKEEASGEESCCSMEIEEIPEGGEASEAEVASEAEASSSSEDAATSDEGGSCCGSNGAATQEGEPVGKEKAPAA